MLTPGMLVLFLVLVLKDSLRQLLTYATHEENNIDAH